MDNNFNLARLLRTDLENIKKNRFENFKYLSEQLSNKRNITYDNVDAALDWITVVNRCWRHASSKPEVRSGFSAAFETDGILVSDSVMDDYSEKTRALRDQIIVAKTNLQSEQQQLQSDLTYTPRKFEGDNSLKQYEKTGNDLRTAADEITINEMTRLSKTIYGEFYGGKRQKLPFLSFVPLLAPEKRNFRLRLTFLCYILPLLFDNSQSTKYLEKFQPIFPSS